MDAEQVAGELIEHAERIDAEIRRVWGAIGEPPFLGDNNNLPHAHYGYLMGLLSVIDVLAICDMGERAVPSQTRRMRRFLDEYVGLGQTEAHLVLVQMMRHTLMHSGALREVYDPDTGTLYTWSVYFGDDPSGQFPHYTVTPLPDEPFLDHYGAIAAEFDVHPTSVAKLNLTVTGLAADVLTGTRKWVKAMLADEDKKALAVAEYSKIRIGRIPSGRAARSHE